MDAADTLPDDPAFLKQMIVQIKREAAERMEAMEQRHKAEMEAVFRRFYGPKSERFDPGQLLLFGIVVDSLAVDVDAVEAEAGEKLTTRRVQHKHGRAKLPESLPRIPIEHDLKAEEKLCPCCGQERCRIGSEVSEQLEYVPASFKVLQHIRFKYACKPCENNGDGPQIEIAVKPAQPIEKGLPGPGLLAYVITGKLADHLPLYRLESIFARLDVHIARSTMCCLDSRCRQIGQAPGRPDGRPSAAIQGDPHRRDTIARSGEGPVQVGEDVDVHWRRGQSVHRLRLHPRPHPRRAGGMAVGLQRLPASRRLWWLRWHLRRWEHHRGRLLGPRAAEVLRSQGH
jgi:transposase